MPRRFPSPWSIEERSVMQLDSTITCPKCGYQAIETMPTDAFGSLAMFHPGENREVRQSPAWIGGHGAEP